MSKEFSAVLLLSIMIFFWVATRIMKKKEKNNVAKEDNMPINASKSAETNFENLEISSNLYALISGKLQNRTFLIITDTHDALREDDFKEFSNDYEACFLLGDIGSMDLKIILRHVPKEKIYGVYGDYDYYGMYEDNGVQNIHGIQKMLGGVSFVGFEGSARYKSGDCPMYSPEESIEVEKKLMDADILISHDCAHGLLTSEKHGAHIGLDGITHYMKRKSALINICGHYHNEDVCIYKEEGEQKMTIFLSCGVTYLCLDGFLS